MAKLEIVAPQDAISERSRAYMAVKVAMQEYFEHPHFEHRSYVRVLVIERDRESDYSEDVWVPVERDHAYGLLGAAQLFSKKWWPVLHKDERAGLHLSFKKGDH